MNFLLTGKMTVKLIIVALFHCSAIQIYSFFLLFSSAFTYRAFIRIGISLAFLFLFRIFIFIIYLKSVILKNSKVGRKVFFNKILIFINYFTRGCLNYIQIKQNIGIFFSSLIHLSFYQRFFIN